jgi:hypothetical protein
MARYRKTYDDLGHVPNAETYGREKATRVAKGYGPLKFRESRVFDTPVSNAPQDLNSGDSTQGYSERGGRAHYLNDTDSDWRRGMGHGPGSPERGEKPNHDWNSFHEPPAVGKSHYYADPKEKPPSYHAITDNHRTGAGRPESRVTQYQPGDKKTWWAKLPKGAG